jgi:ADP-ribosyl-[dinitrogen reductase] hydrolase
MNAPEVTMNTERDAGSRFGLLMERPPEEMRDEALLDRALGCLFGQVAGDSLGGLVEFQDADEILGGYPQGVRNLQDGGHWRTIAGQPTDDSEMALALARSIVARGTFDLKDVVAAYGHWYDSRPFDMGNTVAAALGAATAAAGRRGDALAAARAAGNPDSQANGALMRVSPLGVFGHALPSERVADWARQDASLTHPHPACRDASAVFAAAIAYAVRTGSSPRGVYGWATEWSQQGGIEPSVRQWLGDAATQGPADFMTQMGWVRIAFQNAFYRLLHAPIPAEGVIQTVMRGGDTDTNAAIAGALLGAVHGAAAWPAQWRNAVLTCRPERGHPNVLRPRPRDFWPADLPLLAEWLVTLGKDTAKAR